MCNAQYNMYTLLTIYLFIYRYDRNSLYDICSMKIALIIIQRHTYLLFDY